MQIQTRPATSADAEAIAFVRVAAWRAAYREFMPAGFLAALDPMANLNSLKAKLDSSEPRSHLRVAQVNGAVVAYVTYGTPRYSASAGTLELWALNIMPAYWRQGIGRVLVQEVLAEARQAAFTSVELWCIVGNTPAALLYESLGFVLNGQNRTNSNLTGHPLHEFLYAMTC